MDATTVALVGSTTTAIVTIVGWSVSHVLANRREHRTRRLEAALDYAERQIEELYGPLLSLIEQIFTVWTVRERVLFPDGRVGIEAPGDAERQRLIKFFQEAYFFPLHEKIRDILSSKLHLVDGQTVPPSFYAYLEHATQQLVQHRLFQEFRLSTLQVPGVPWPQNFYHDVKDSLEEIMARSDRYLRDLETGGVYRVPRASPSSG